MLIQPEQRTYVDIPAEYQIVDRQVVVSEGSSGWRRVAIPRHCGAERLVGRQAPAADGHLLAFMLPPSMQRSGYTSSARSHRFNPSTSPSSTAAATRRPTAAPNL